VSSANAVSSTTWITMLTRAACPIMKFDGILMRIQDAEDDKDCSVNSPG